jgi:phage tail sheath protein FI
MPQALTYPGVYIEEQSSGVHTITGVATSITAFVGGAAMGPVNQPVTIFSFADFERQFGGLTMGDPLGYAVRDFYANGGSTAIIVRVGTRGAAAAPAPPPAPPAPADPPPAAAAASIALAATGASPDHLELHASSIGAWGNALGVEVDHPDDPTHFNLLIGTFGAEGTFTVAEQLFNLSVDPGDPRYVVGTLATESQLVVVADPSQVPDQRPDRTPGDATQPLAAVRADEGSGTDPVLTDADLIGDQAAKTGLYALDNADLFNLLVIPPLTPGGEVADEVIRPAPTPRPSQRAVLLVDAGAGWTRATAVSSLQALGLSGSVAANGAVYFPRLMAPDPLRGGQLADYPPSGAVAGVIAATDAARGVWKAPAGVDAAIAGIQGLTVPLTDDEQGSLNPKAVNCIRNFPVFGSVVWGARTLRGDDQLADDWKYLPVRRTALFIEESLYRGTKWVVFEPNDEPLWASIRLSIGAFMHDLFRQGAFQGATPRDAYFVKCDHDTTTQNDINLGRVNIAVGFAPLKPAEFVVITIEQMAGQVEV